MNFQLIKYSVNSGDFYILADDKIYYVSYPYEKIDMIEITQNQLMNSNSILHDIFIECYDFYDSYQEIINFVNNKYIEDVEKNPLLVANNSILKNYRKRKSFINDTKINTQKTSGNKKKISAFQEAVLKAKIRLAFNH